MRSSVSVERGAKNMSVGADQLVRPRSRNSPLNRRTQVRPYSLGIVFPFVRATMGIESVTQQELPLPQVLGYSASSARRIGNRNQRRECNVTRRVLQEVRVSNQARLDFGEIPWEEPASGVRFKALSREGRKLRLVEFASGFIEEDWCTKEHIGYVLEGTIDISFPGMSVRFSAGDGIFILGGEAEKHKASVVGEKVTLILVERA